MIDALNRSKRLCETRRFRSLFRVFPFQLQPVFSQNTGRGKEAQGKEPAIEASCPASFMD